MEEWKIVKSNQKYEVSNFGRVKNTKTKRILKAGGTKYNQVNLSKNGIQTTHYVHRLVAHAFLGESDLQVNHINKIKTDNRVENLEYVTQRENRTHAVSVGYCGVQERHGRFRAIGSIKGKVKHLGTYDTPEEANQAYKNALNEINEFNKYS